MLSEVDVIVSVFRALDEVCDPDPEIRILPCSMPRHDIFPLVVRSALIIAVSWACWRLLQRLLEKNDLDNVPGPVSHSFLNGGVQPCFFSTSTA